MKTALLIFVLAIGTTLGAARWKPRGLGAAKGLPGRSTPYIIGGEIVEGRQYPGEVSIEFFGMNSCGGSILNENYLLTAAHCAEPDVLDVLAGTNDLYEGGSRHIVKDIYVHEEYDENDAWHNDIAVMRVEPPFVLDNSTAPVTLVSPGQVTPVGTVATVIGWGRLSEEGVPPPHELRKVDIMIADHVVCQKAYEGDRFKIHEEQICAGVDEGNKGPCSGDSGSPLFVDGKVVGIVSWSRGCAEKGFPTVFTEVSHYIEWIESKIKI